MSNEFLLIHMHQDLLYIHHPFLNKHHFNNTFAFENHLKDKKSLKKILPESVSIIPHPGMLEEFGWWFILFTC